MSINTFIVLINKQSFFYVVKAFQIKCKNFLEVSFLKKTGDFDYFTFKLLFCDS